MDSQDSQQQQSTGASDWQRCVRICLQSGGKLTFILEDSAINIAPWLKVVSEQYLPVLMLNVAELKNGVFQTEQKDLVLFWNAELLNSVQVNSAIQGARALIGAQKFDGNLVDFHWPSLSLQMWTDFFQEFRSQTKKVLSFPQSFPRPCLFLDRDDVIIENVPYNSNPANVTLMPGIVDLINLAHASSYWVVMVSNQSGLARKKITWKQYQKVHQQALRLLAEQGAWLDQCEWASALLEAEMDAGILGVSLRKPRSGMFQVVNEKLGVDFMNSLMVGDSATDLIAAYGVGIPNLYLLNSVKTQSQVEELQKFALKKADFSYRQISTLNELAELHFKSPDI